MYKKTKALLSGILASILVESMVFTSVAAPITDYNTSVSIESSIEELDDYGGDTNDANVAENDTKDESDNNDLEQEDSIEDNIEDSVETDDIQADDKEVDNIETDDKEVDSIEDDIEANGVEDDTENKTEDKSQENEVIDKNEETEKGENEVIKDSESNESVEVDKENNTVIDKIDEDNSDDTNIKEEVEDNEIDESEFEDKVLENDLVQEGVPFRITPRQAVDKNNLSTALQEVHLYTEDDEEIEEGGQLVTDKYYYLDLVFEEDDENQFNGIDTYVLPYGFKALGKDVSGNLIVKILKLEMCLKVPIQSIHQV